MKTREPVLCKMVADEAAEQYFANIFMFNGVSDCRSVRDRDAVEMAIDQLFKSEYFDHRRRGLLADRLLCELDSGRHPADIVDEKDALALYRDLIEELLPMVHKRIKKRCGLKYEEMQLRRDDLANLLQIHPDLLRSAFAA